MKRLLCSRLPEPGKQVILSESEAKHAIQVLRLRDGDPVEAMDGRGAAAPARLRIRGEGGVPRLEAAPELGSARRESDVREAVPVRLAVAVLKGEAMEWVIEKAVELGVERVVPLLTAHTVVQVDRKGPEAFQQRWQKIADQALKQCGRLVGMQVDPPTSLKAWLETVSADTELVFWCDEAGREELPRLSSALVEAGSNATATLLIGPEGGWSEAERELLARAGARRVSLGPLVLRAETAALFGVSILSEFLSLTTR